MQTMTLKGEGVTILASREVGERLIRANVGLKMVPDSSNNDCEPGGCGTCSARTLCTQRV